MPPRRPKAPQLGAKDGLRTAQEAPKMIQEPPKSCPGAVQEAAHGRLGAMGRTRAAQEPSKSHQRAAKEPPKSRPDCLQTSILDQSGYDIIQFLFDFWRDSGKSLRRRVHCIAGFQSEGRRKGRSLFRFLVFIVLL